MCVKCLAQPVMMTSVKSDGNTYIARAACFSSSIISQSQGEDVYTYKYIYMYIHTYMYIHVCTYTKST